VTKKIAAVFVLALAVRWIAFAFFPPRPIAYDDGVSWDGIAVNLAEGKGFTENDGSPTSVRPPVYPLFLAGVYKIFGHEPGAARAVQLSLGALTAVFILLIGWKVLDEKSGLWAGLLTAVYPPLIVYVTGIGSETLYAFLLVGTVLLFLLAREKDHPGLYAAAGLALGTANLCRSTLAFFPFFLIAGAFWLGERGKRLKGLVFACVLSFLVILPWTVRNYRVFGGFLLVNISAGQLFWLGTIEETGGRFVELDYPGYRQFDHLSLEKPIEAEREHFRAGLRNIAANPLGFAKLTVVKFFRLWFEPIGYAMTKERSRAAARILLAAHAALIFLAGWGLYAGRGRAGSLLVLYALFAYFAVMHNLVAPMPRFRLPMEPFIVLFAVHALLNPPRVRKGGL